MAAAAAHPSAGGGSSRRLAPSSAIIGAGKSKFISASAPPTSAAGLPFASSTTPPAPGMRPAQSPALALRQRIDGGIVNPCSLRSVAKKPRNLVMWNPFPPTISGSDELRRTRNQTSLRFVCVDLRSPDAQYLGVEIPLSVLRTLFTGARTMYSCNAFNA